MEEKRLGYYERKLFRKPIRILLLLTQQWKEAKLLIQDYKIKELFGDNEVVEMFALYMRQEDPNSVYEKLSTNTVN